jgi:uncharacterized protein YukE
MPDFSVDTGDLGALARVFQAAGTDARAIAASFRAGAGRLTSGDALGRPDVVAVYAQAIDQWTHNLDDIASSMEKLAHALGLARDLYEAAEREATVRAR